MLYCTSAVNLSAWPLVQYCSSTVIFVVLYERSVIRPVSSEAVPYPHSNLLHLKSASNPGLMRTIYLVGNVIFVLDLVFINLLSIVLIDVDGIL